MRGMTYSPGVDFRFLVCHMRNLEIIAPILTARKELNRLKVNSSS